MRGTRKRTRAVLALAGAGAMMAFGLVACSSDDDGGGSGGGGSSASLDGQTVEVAAVWSGAEQEAFGEVLSQFEEDTGADVTYTSTGDDIATVLGGRIDGGDPPDVAILPQPGLMKDLADQGALKAVDDVAGDLVDEHYAPVWRELGTVDDTLYGVWFKAANKSTIWYRPQAIEDAGVDVPETWEDLITAAGTVRDSGVTPFAVAGGDGWTLTDWFENVYLRTAGPDMYDQLTAHEIPWTDESVTTALETLAELWSKPDLLASGSKNMTFPESVTTVFADEDAAMVYEGDFVAGTITDETDAELGTDADFFPFPSVDGSDPMVVGGGDVAVSLTDSEAGKELIKYLATPEAAEIWADIGGFTSPNKDTNLDTYPDDITRRSAKELVDAETFRFDMSDLTPSAFGGTPSQGEWKALQDFLADPSDVSGVQEALESSAKSAYN